MRLVPQVQESNLEDYNQLMGELGLRKSTTQRKPYFALRKVCRCYRYFQERLAALVKEMESNEERTNLLLDIYDKIKSAMVVKIEVSSHSDAYVLFESLNNRGTPLTAVDLMKNLIMAKAEGSGISTDDCFDQWSTLLDSFLDEVTLCGGIYSKIVFPQKTDIENPYADNLLDLQHIQGAPSYILLLYLLRNLPRRRKCSTGVGGYDS